MTNHSGGGTPQYILDFIKQICPEYPNLYLASFNEELCLRDATELILSLQRQLSAAQSALAVANSRNQEEIEADRAMTRALAVAETAGVGGQCATCSFRYWEHKGHIIPCPLCRAEAAEARAGEAREHAIEECAKMCDTESLAYKQNAERCRIAGNNMGETGDIHGELASQSCAALIRRMK